MASYPSTKMRDISHILTAFFVLHSEMFAFSLAGGFHPLILKFFKMLKG